MAWTNPSYLFWTQTKQHSEPMYSSSPAMRQCIRLLGRMFPKAMRHLLMRLWNIWGCLFIMGRMMLLSILLGCFSILTVLGGPIFTTGRGPGNKSGLLMERLSDGSKIMDVYGLLLSMGLVIWCPLINLLLLCLCLDTLLEIIMIGKSDLC